MQISQEIFQRFPSVSFVQKPGNRKRLEARLLVYLSLSICLPGCQYFQSCASLLFPLGLFLLHTLAAGHHHHCHICFSLQRNQQQYTNSLHRDDTDNQQR